MITHFQMYLIVKATGVSEALVFIGLLLAIFGSVATMACWADEKFEVAKRIVAVAIAGAVMFAVGGLIPNTQQIAAIYLIPKIVNNERVQDLPNKLIDLGEQWVDELKPKKN